jgi:hypothetical protein
MADNSNVFRILSTFQFLSYTTADPPPDRIFLWRFEDIRRMVVKVAV